MADESDSSGPSGDVWFLPWLGLIVRLVPALLGALLGTAGWLVTGWPWWPLIGAVVLWVVAFLYPLFWPGVRATRYSMLTELLLVVRPRRGLTRMQAEEEAWFRRAPIPAYGLSATFVGARWLLSSGAHRGRHGHGVWRLSLGHGSLYYPESPWLFVETAVRQPATAEAQQRRRLTEWLWPATLRQNPDIKELRRRRAEIEARPDPEWSSTDIAIDGVPVSFESLSDGERWAARAVHGDVMVTLMANWMPVESVALVTITDLQPYVDGHPAPPSMPP